MVSFLDLHDTHLRESCPSKNTSHGHPEPSAFDFGRRPRLDIADEYGHDSCARHRNEFNGLCRTYTSDKLVKFWLGISISAYIQIAQTQPTIPKRKGQPGENKLGRYQCGRSECKTSRANEFDIRRHLMLQHAPSLLKGPRDGKSRTEPGDGHREFQKYIQGYISTWFARFSPAGLILLCEKVGVCCLSPTRLRLLCESLLPLLVR